MPFFDLRLFILHQAPHSLVLAPACGALVTSLGFNSSVKSFSPLCPDLWDCFVKDCAEERLTIYRTTWTFNSPGEEAFLVCCLVVLGFNAT